jgi:hypothetical protein
MRYNIYNNIDHINHRMNFGKNFLADVTSKNPIKIPENSPSMIGHYGNDQIDFCLLKKLGIFINFTINHFTFPLDFIPLTTHR